MNTFNDPEDLNQLNLKIYPLYIDDTEDEFEDLKDFLEEENISSDIVQPRLLIIQDLIQMQRKYNELVSKLAVEIEVK